MFRKLQDLLEMWSSRKIAIVVIVVSVAFSEIIVIASDLLLHKSLVVETIIRTFLISFSISTLMALTYSRFMERLRRAEAALRTSEAENGAILMALPDMMLRFSFDGRFLQQHIARSHTSRCPAERFTGKTVYEVFPPELADQMMHYITAAMRTREMQQFKYQLPYTDAPCYFEARMVECNGDSVLTIIRDITTQKIAEAALEAERESLARRVEERTAALQTANKQTLHALQTRDEFLANINHELRTPLTPILAFSDLLQNEHYGPLNSRQKQISGNIKKSAQDLLEHINNILDFSDIKAGKMQLEIEALNVNDLCQASLRQLEHAARKKDLRVSCTLDHAVTIIQADPQRLNLMLNHLLKNAIKFTPNGGAIGLEVRSDTPAGLVHFSVWDTGIGIDSAHLPQLFQPFSQLQTNLNHEYEGSGLGLALVHYLAELHGGSVAVESQVGKGSRFTISLPWNTLLPPQPEADDTLVLSPEAATPSTTGKQPLILVAEDNAMNRKVLCHMLNMAGYATVVAEDGAAAIEALREHHPDLVLMDIQMPGMNGLEATRRIRADADLHDTPIIAVTALTMPEDRKRSQEAGVDHYVSKPMDMQQLLKIIAKTLNARPTRQVQEPAEDGHAP
ncbi:MAG: response regulator [Anaerolineae bacterium]|nr:response regulator [Anaerolineae bacterium]